VSKTISVPLAISRLLVAAMVMVFGLSGQAKADMKAGDIIASATAITRSSCSRTPLNVTFPLSVNSA
jgi:hypothetical protein